MTEEKNWFAESGRAGGAGRANLIRSLVVLGGAVGVSCGTTPSDDGTGGTGGAASGSGGQGMSTGGLSSGGFSTGGVSTGGGGTGGVGTGGVGTGGFFAGGGAGEGGAFSIFDCPPAQWECENAGATCDYERQRVVSEASCSCNPARPLAVSDCAEGESLACLAIDGTEESGYFDEPVPANCWCTSGSASCNACEELDFSAVWPNGECEVEPMGGSVLCGCAVVVLK